MLLQWLRGFVATVDGVPTAAQWEVLKAELRKYENGNGIALVAVWPHVAPPAYVAPPILPPPPRRDEPIFVS